MRDRYGVPRKRGVWYTGGGVIVIASLTVFSPRLFSFTDFVANDIFLILGAFIMSIFVGWVWKIPCFATAAGIESPAARMLWTLLIKYLAPIIILVCWIARLRIGG